MEKTCPHSPSPSLEGDNHAHAIAGVEPFRRRLMRGEYLFRQGEESFGIFRLLSGQVVMNRVTAEGTEVPMHTVRPGEVFAEASLFSAEYHCDAVAILDCDVLVYSKNSLVRQLRTKPEDLWNFTAELAHRVQSLRTRLQIRQIRSAKERIMNALEMKCGETRVWKLDTTLKHFADEIGLTHEALYRALATLEDEGRISRSPQQIAIY